MTPKLKARLASVRPVINAANNSGATCNQIAKRLRVSRSTVENYCKWLGIQLQNKLTRNRKVDYSGWSPMIARMRHQGLKENAIAQRLGVAPSTITKWKHRAR